MNSILYFDPARERWDSRRPDSVRNRPADPLANTVMNVIAVTWFDRNSAGLPEVCENQAHRVNRIIEQQSPTLIALAGVPRTFLNQLLAQPSVRTGYAFSSIEAGGLASGQNSAAPEGCCALLWKHHFSVLFVEPKSTSKGFPCMLAHSRDLFGTQAVLATAAFTSPGTAAGAEQLRDVWESYLNSVSGETTVLALCYVGAAVQIAAGVRSQLPRVEAACDGPHAVWFRNTESRRAMQSQLSALQDFGDKITHITLAQLIANQSPSVTPPTAPLPNTNANPAAGAAAGANSGMQRLQSGMQQPQASANSGVANSGLASGGAAGGSMSRATTADTPASLGASQPPAYTGEQRTWHSRNYCNIRVREHTNEVLYDLSTLFGRYDECIRALNSGEAFRWNSDFAICQGRLFACQGVKPDLRGFQAWTQQHDAPLTLDQRAELFKTGRVAAHVGAGAGATGAGGQQQQQPVPGDARALVGRLACQRRQQPHRRRAFVLRPRGRDELQRGGWRGRLRPAGMEREPRRAHAPGGARAARLRRHVARRRRAAHAAGDGGPAQRRKGARRRRGRQGGPAGKLPQGLRHVLLPRAPRLLARVREQRAVRAHGGAQRRAAAQENLAATGRRPCQVKDYL